MTSEKTRRICPEGHQYYKSSDCPVCPVCEKERGAENEFLAALSAPARRALESRNITSLLRLAEWTEKELLTLHGMGPASMPKLREALKQKGLSFRKS